MEKLTYPLVCYQLSEDACLGILLGTDYKMVEKDIKSLKSSLAEHLQKQYKKYDDYPYTNIIKPKLGKIDVKIRPAYREDGGQYPMPTTTKVPLTIVYGENDSNYYECYFPLLGENFYYYDTKQFKSLCNHFAVNILNRKTPEEINKLFLHPEPILDEVSLRVNYDRDYDWGNNAYQRNFKNLSRLAEKFPYSKSERRKISSFPDAAWEREAIVEDMSSRIAVEQSNILVVGESGTGKSSVIRQTFRKLDTRYKKQGGEQTFWRIMPQRITASSKYLGEWQEKCESLIQELEYAKGMLWVEDISQLMMIGGEGPEDSVAAFFTSFLRDGKLRMVGEVSPSQLESMRRMLPGFVENFRIIELDELQESKVYRILDKFADYSKKNLKITISQKALEQSYRLLLRYYPYEKFPGKAVRFLSGVINEARLNEADEITHKEIIKEFSQRTGLPDLFLRDDIKLDQAELSDWFTSRIIGQSDAIERLCQVVKIYKAGLNNPHKPISTLLFAGPTGVGKTASAKALADYFFGKGQKTSPLIRIDMSEFRYPGSQTMLLGSGKSVGKLVKEVRERPFAVLLLDEVEKAHPTVFDALLGLLDEGRQVDIFGRITNFRNTIIIMTSNLGASNQSSLGFKDTESSSVKYESAIGKFFRPEFVNRIDNVVMFNALTEKDIQQIAKKELEELSKREGFVKNNIQLVFKESLVDYIRQTGFDERYGARPLQRAVEDEVTSPLANWLLEQGNIKDCTLEISYKNGLEIRKS